MELLKQQRPKEKESELVATVTAPKIYEIFVTTILCSLTRVTMVQENVYDNYSQGRESVQFRTLRTVI